MRGHNQFDSICLIVQDSMLELRLLGYILVLTLACKIDPDAHEIMLPITTEIYTD